MNGITGSIGGAGKRPEGGSTMLRNMVRGILGIVLAAAATWLANFIVEKLFGPEDAERARA